MLEKFINHFQKIVLIFGLFLFGVIFLGSFSFIQGFSLGKENIVLNILFVCFLLFLLIGLILYVFKKINSMSKKQLYITSIILFIFVTLVFVFLLYNLQILPITDSYAMLDQAAHLSQNNHLTVTSQDLYGYYFGAYSNNYLMTIVFKYIFVIIHFFGIKNVYLPFYIINVICMLIGILLTWLITKKMFNIKTATKVLVFSALNPIYYGITFWVYTCTFSIPLSMLIIYLGICLYKTDNYKIEILLSILEGIVVIVGYFIRPTALIPFIAMFISAIILLIKHRNYKKYLRIMISIVISIIFSYNLISQLNNKYFGSISNQNFPITHWLMMSSHGEGLNDPKDVQYTLSFDTKEAKTKATINKTIEHYKDLGFFGTIELYGKKMITTWSDGFSRIDVRFSQAEDYNRLYSFIVGDNQGLLYAYAVAFRIVTLFFIFIEICHLLKGYIDQKYFFMVVSLIGGIVFYILWEAKGIYSAPFLLIMFMLSQNGVSLSVDYVSKHIRSFSMLRTIPLMSIMFTIVLSLNMFLTLSEKIEHKNYIIKSATSAFLEPIMINEGEVIQEFYSSKEFNHLSLRVEEIEKSSGHTLSILDENNTVLVHQNFDSSQCTGNTITFHFKNIKPKHRQKYYVKINSLSQDNSLQVFYRKRYVLDQYQGKCFVDNQEKNYDIFMSVYHQEESSTLRTKENVCLSIFMVISIIILNYGYYHEIKKS